MKSESGDATNGSMEKENVIPDALESIPIDNGSNLDSNSSHVFDFQKKSNGSNASIASSRSTRKYISANIPGFEIHSSVSVQQQQQQPIYSSDEPPPAGPIGHFSTRSIDNASNNNFGNSRSASPSPSDTRNKPEIQNIPYDNATNFGSYQSPSPVFQTQQHDIAPIRRSPSPNPFVSSVEAQNSAANTQSYAESHQSNLISEVILADSEEVEDLQQPKVSQELVGQNDSLALVSNSPIPFFSHNDPHNDLDLFNTASVVAVEAPAKNPSSPVPSTRSISSVKKASPAPSHGVVRGLSRSPSPAPVASNPTAIDDTVRLRELEEQMLHLNKQLHDALQLKEQKSRDVHDLQAAIDELTAENQQLRDAQYSQPANDNLYYGYTAAGLNGADPNSGGLDPQQEIQALYEAIQQRDYEIQSLQQALADKQTNLIDSSGHHKPQEQDTEQIEAQLREREENLTRREHEIFELMDSYQQQKKELEDSIQKRLDEANSVAEKTKQQAYKILQDAEETNRLIAQQQETFMVDVQSAQSEAEQQRINAMQLELANERGSLKDEKERLDMIRTELIKDRELLDGERQLILERESAMADSMHLQRILEDESAHIQQARIQLESDRVALVDQEETFKQSLKEYTKSKSELQSEKKQLQELSDKLQKEKKLLSDGSFKLSEQKLEYQKHFNELLVKEEQVKREEERLSRFESDLNEKHRHLESDLQAKNSDIEQKLKKHELTGESQRQESARLEQLGKELRAKEAAILNKEGEISREKERLNQVEQKLFTSMEAKNANEYRDLQSQLDEERAKLESERAALVKKNHAIEEKAKIFEKERLNVEQRNEALNRVQHELDAERKSLDESIKAFNAHSKHIGSHGGTNSNQIEMLKKQLEEERGILAKKEAATKMIVQDFNSKSQRLKEEYERLELDLDKFGEAKAKLERERNAFEASKQQYLSQVGLGDVENVKEASSGGLVQELRSDIEKMAIKLAQSEHLNHELQATIRVLNESLQHKDTQQGPDVSHYRKGSIASALSSQVDERVFHLEERLNSVAAAEEDLRDLMIQNMSEMDRFKMYLKPLLEGSNINLSVNGDGNSGFQQGLPPKELQHQGSTSDFAQVLVDLSSANRQLVNKLETIGVQQSAGPRSSSPVKSGVSSKSSTLSMGYGRHVYDNQGMPASGSSRQEPVPLMSHKAESASNHSINNGVGYNDEARRILSRSRTFGSKAMGSSNASATSLLSNTLRSTHDVMKAGDRHGVSEDGANESVHESSGLSGGLLINNSSNSLSLKPPLYENANRSIVSDGNRRTSMLLGWDIRTPQQTGNGRHGSTISISSSSSHLKRLANASVSAVGRVNSRHVGPDLYSNTPNDHKQQNNAKDVQGLNAYFTQDDLAGLSETTRRILFGNSSNQSVNNISPHHGNRKTSIDDLRASIRQKIRERQQHN